MTNYSVTGKKILNDFECFIIEIKAKISKEGTVKERGMDFTLTGEVVDEGTIYFAINEAILVRFAAKGEDEENLTLPENPSMKIKRTSKNSITIGLLK